ncbi:MAG: hypothetical protein ABIL09_28050, partial [Gemmatimonadota bacterium]
QAKRFYGRLGCPERVELVEAPGPHGFGSPLRQAAAAWMRRWLLGIDEPVTEADVPIRTAGELACTPRGQVHLLPGLATVFERHAAEGARQRERRPRLPAAALRTRVRQLVAAPAWAVVPVPQVEVVSRRRRRGLGAEELVLRSGLAPALPARLLQPHHWNGTAVLWADGMGRQGAGRAPLALARQGCRVLLVDLSEVGDPRRAAVRGGFLAYLLGRSLVGQRVAEVLVCARYLLQGAPGRPPRQLRLVGTGEAGPAVLHAAALEPRRFHHTSVRRSLAAWADLLANTAAPLEQVTQVVCGALAVYDLPDLARLVPAGRLEVLDPVDGAGQPVPRPEAG